MKISLNIPFKNMEKNNRNKQKKDSNRKNILKVNVDYKRHISNDKVELFEKEHKIKNIREENKVKKLKRTGDLRNKEKYKFKLNHILKKQKELGNTARKKLPKSYFALLTSMIFLAVISVKLSYDSYVKSGEEDFAVFSSLDNTVENDLNTSNNLGNLQSDESNNKDTKQVNETENTNKKSNTINTSNQKNDNTKNTSTYVEKIEPLVFSKPINGTIQKLYSPDKVIYSKTLEMWKTHDGIDISVNLSDTVKSIERGKVEKIYEDAFLGVTVIIDHSQGYKSIYSNLEKDVFVKEKQTVLKGTKIGRIGKTAIGEYNDDPHLHFSLKYNNEIVDPTYIFK